MYGRLARSYVDLWVHGKPGFGLLIVLRILRTKEIDIFWSVTYFRFIRLGLGGLGGGVVTNQMIVRFNSFIECSLLQAVNNLCFNGR